jgi:hypothetical protein
MGNILTAQDKPVCIGENGGGEKAMAGQEGGGRKEEGWREKRRCMMVGKGEREGRVGKEEERDGM